VVVIPPPVVTSIVRSSPNPASGETVNFQVTFSKNVTGVDESYFSLTTTGVTDATISSVTGSGSIYTVTVNTGSGSTGTIRLDVLDNDTIVDEDSIPLGGSYTNGPVYTIDKTPHVASIVRSSPNPASSETINFNVTFSKNVIGVDESDFSLTTRIGQRLYCHCQYRQWQWHDPSGCSGR
jgi:hypothetical protein